MPRKARRQGGNPTLEEPADPILPNKDEADDSDLPIFTQLKRYSETEWDRLLVYLYRLEPRVKNSDGPAYIEKFGRAIDEDDIKNAHGGGKYQVWLKDTATDETVRKVNITIAGAPILQSNQILQPSSVTAPGAPAPAGTAPAAPDALTTVVTLLERTLHDIKRDQPSQEQANKILMDTFAQAQRLSMDMLARQQGADSTSSNSVMDKILTIALERMTKEKDPMAEMKSAVEMMKLLRPDKPAAEPADPLGTLKNLKDVLGVDLKELLEKRGGGEGGDGPHWAQPLVASIPQLIGEIPKVFEQLNQGKRIDLETARIQLERERLHAAVLAHRGALPAQPTSPLAPIGPGAVGAAPATSAAVSGASPANPADTLSAPMAPGAASPAPANPSANPEAEFDRAAELVVRSFNDGYNGEIACTVVRIAHPAVVMQLAPYADNKEVIAGIVGQHPILSQISMDPDYPQFLNEFIAALAKDADDEEEDQLEPAGAGAQSA